MEEAVSERRKAFAAAHRSDEDRQAYISASRRTSSVIAKPEAWQTSCSSLSPKSVHSVLCSIAGSSSSSSSSPNFPNCSPRESASVYAAYLRFHFSVFQPKALRSRARGYLSEVRRAMCSEESHSSFCSPFSCAEFHAAAFNVSSSTATGPDKVAYPMLKHLPCSGMDFLLHNFNVSWSSDSFPSIWKTSSIIPIHKMVKLLDPPASFRPISLTSCVSKLFERIILSRLLFFLESNSILSPPARPVSALDGLHLIKFCTFLSPFWMGLTNPGRAFGQSCLLSISPKLFTLSGILPFCINLFQLASLLALLVGLNLSFLIGALLWFIKITKVIPFEFVKVFRKDPFLALYFSLFINDLPASLRYSVSCSLYADDLAIWSSSLLVPTVVEATQGALFRLERWSKYWCLPLNPSKCEGSFFSVDPHQANLQPNLLLLGSRLRLNPTPTFLGVTF